jgi:hypothetical protein
MALCGAKKKNGEPCRAFSGQGTDHPGVGRCKFHLGNTPNMRKHAVKLQAEKEVSKARAKFGERIPVDPTEALLTTLQLSAGQLFWLQAALEDHEDKHDFTGQVLMRLWNDERDRVARISEAALRAGVQERAILQAERYGLKIAQLVDHILDDPELGLDLSREIKGALVRRALLAVDGEGVDGEALAIEAR